MKIVLTGADGQLGRSCARIWADAHTITPLDHHKLDITDLEHVRAVISSARPEAVVNCAAWNAVDGSESNPEPAWSINAHGPRNLAIACQEVGATLVHFSTDYVFDGNTDRHYIESDSVNPLSEYGRSKAAGEEAVKDHTDRFITARVAWLFGIGGRNFIETMMRVGNERGEVAVVNDQWGTPTFTDDVAIAAEKLLRQEFFGLFHLSSVGETTWNGFAAAIFREAQLDVKVSETTTEAMNRPAPRPRYSVLDNTHLRATLQKEMPTWEDALARYMSAR